MFFLRRFSFCTQNHKHCKNNWSYQNLFQSSLSRWILIGLGPMKSPELEFPHSRKLKFLLKVCLILIHIHTHASIQMLQPHFTCYSPFIWCNNPKVLPLVSQGGSTKGSGRQHGRQQQHPGRCSPLCDCWETPLFNMVAVTMTEPGNGL